MVTHSSILAWKIPWTEEPGRLQSMWSQNQTWLSDFIKNTKLQKNWCFCIVVLEKTLEHSFECKEIKSINLKWNQPWIFIGRTGAEAEASILWPPGAMSWFIGKDHDAGKDGRQKEKEAAEDEITDLWTWIWANFGRQWENRGAWHVAVHGVTKSQTGLSDWTTTARIKTLRPQE